MSIDFRCMLIVLNSQKSKEKAETKLAGLTKGLVLETCLRDMVLLTETDFQKIKDENPEATKGFDLYSGFQAVEYLIKVLSGLESPVLGETEVLGQFKKQVLPQLQTKTELSEIVQFVLNLVKLVRTKHLIGSGSQSYGSLVRRILKGEKHILFIGSGVLAESIHPWVKESKNTMVSVRSKERYRQSELSKQNPELKAFGLDDDFRFDFPLNVIVCAPIKAKALEIYLKNANVNKVIDLREESKTDPVTEISCEIFDLEQVFEEVSQKDIKKESLLKAVQADISDKIEEKFVKHRPFGWDDLCL